MTSMAKEAGHSLDSCFRCVRCRLQVDMRKNLPYLEAVLHMRCSGTKFTGLELVQPPKMDEGIFLFHRLRVHSSHRMATHFGLQIHFCTRCGFYGQPAGKVVGLRDPCSPPTRAGIQALRNILKGNWPTGIGNKQCRKLQQDGHSVLSSGRCSKVLTREPSEVPLISLELKGNIAQPCSIEFSASDASILQSLNGASSSARLASNSLRTPAQTPIQCTLGMGSVPVEGASAPPGPSVARAVAGQSQHSSRLACPKHQGKARWDMKDPCNECIRLAFEADL